RRSSSTSGGRTSSTCCIPIPLPPCAAATSPRSSPARPSTTRGPRGCAWCRPARTRVATSHGIRRDHGALRVRPQRRPLADGGGAPALHTSQHGAEWRRERCPGELQDVAAVGQQEAEGRPAPELLAEGGECPGVCRADASRRLHLDGEEAAASLDDEVDLLSACAAAV